MPVAEKFDVVVTKSKLEIRALTIEDPTVSSYFAQYKGDSQALEYQLILALKLGVAGLSDSRLLTVINQLGEEADGVLAGLRRKLLIDGTRSGQEAGRDLEKKVLLHELEKLARIFGDTVEGTGEETGLDIASKKGDFVVTVNPHDVGGSEVRIVVEAKSASLTVPGMLNELDHGKQNRMALEAIIVFDARKAPAQVGALRHYPG